jgi:hypothetical protein
MGHELLCSSNSNPQIKKESKPHTRFCLLYLICQRAGPDHNANANGSPLQQCTCTNSVDLSFYEEQAVTSKSRVVGPGHDNLPSQNETKGTLLVEIWFDAYQDVHHPSSMTFDSLFEIRASLMWLTPWQIFERAREGARCFIKRSFSLHIVRID